MPAERGAHYSIIDPATEKLAKGVVLKKRGDALVAEVDGQAVAQLDHFHEDGQQAVFEVESPAGADAAHLITSASPADPGSGIVWQPSAEPASVGAPPGTPISDLPLGGAALGGLLAAAGGGGGGGGSAPAAPAAGSAVAITVVGGPVIDGHGLKVELFAADGVTRLGEATLDANGQVIVKVGDYVGVVIAHVVDTSAGADYLDEATNAPKDLNADLYGIGVVSAANSTLTLNINALTTVAYAKAVEAAGGGNPITATNANATNAAVAKAFGLSDLNSTRIITVNGTTTYDPTDGLDEGEIYGLILAALSGADHNNGGDSQITIDHLVAGITITNGQATLNAGIQQEIIAGGQTAEVNHQGETSGIIDTIAPVFSSGAVANPINENSGAGQVVYTAKTTDASAVTYRLKAGSDAGLSIDGTSGAVTLTENPDYETKASYSFTVVATDAAGNASEQAVTLGIIDLVDETAPTVSSIAITGATGIQNSTLNAGDVVSVTVTMSEATTVTGTPQLALTIGGATVQADYVSGSGTTALVFQYTILAGQNDGNGIGIAADSLRLNGGALTDAAGNAAVLAHGAVADHAGYLVDTTAPTAHFGSATDDVGSIKGALTSGARTDDTSLLLAGTCEAGSTVAVYDGLTLLGAATVSGTSWSYSATVADGTTYQFNVRETDAAGNVSAATPNFTVTGDTTAPDAPSAPDLAADDDTVGGGFGTDTDNITKKTSGLTFTGTAEAGATVELFKDTNNNGVVDAGESLGTTTATAGTWSIDAALAAGGTYSIKAIATDAAGNRGAASAATVVTTADPTVVVFDLVEGVSSSHSNRTFVAGVAYTIYIRVNSDTAALTTGGSVHGTGASWEKWQGVANLGDDDKIELVGSGRDVQGMIGLVGKYKTQMTTWVWATADFLMGAVLLNRKGQISRVAEAGGRSSARLWDGVAGGAGGIPNAGATFNNVYRTAMPDGVLTSQGLA